MEIHKLIKLFLNIALFTILSKAAGCAGPTTLIPQSSHEEIKREESIQREMSNS